MEKQQLDQAEEDIQTLKKEINLLKSSITQLSNKDIQLREPIDSYTKQSIKNIMIDNIADVLWDNVFYIASFDTASLTTTTAELFDTSATSQAGRESDTTGGKIFQPSINCQYKTAFYLGTGIAKSTIYVVSPAVSTLTSIGTSIIDANKSFVGIKIVAGAVSLVSSTNGTVTTIPTSVTITDDTTHVLEIKYYVSHAIVKFNNVIIGDITCNLNPNQAFGTFFPFLTSIGSSDGTSVNITYERFEFSQKRKI